VFNVKLFIDTLTAKKPDVNVEHVKDIFVMLKENYENITRYYHNWKHIQFCLHEFKMISSTIPVEYHFTIILAIYYHDFFYNIYRLDNEEISAKRAMFDLLALGYLEKDIKKIYDTILLTTHENFCDNLEGQIMLDIDLSILGQKYPQFEKYEKGIRKEFRNVPDISYSYNRIKFLKKMLIQESIYQTDNFKEKYEEIARKNIILLVRKYINYIQKRSPSSGYLDNFLSDI
jgi:predicted metal-dependent HD superfamily phosphohydrolase